MTTFRRLLIELGESASTGAVHVRGRPGGVIYLVAGRITYAETPACPGIGERLVASGRIPARAWSAAVAEGHAAGRVGLLLVRDGLIGQRELAMRVTTATCDATHELLWAEDAPVSFVPGERDWLGILDAQRVRLVAARSPEDGPR